MNHVDLAARGSGQYSVRNDHVAARVVPTLIPRASEGRKRNDTHKPANFVRRGAGLSYMRLCLGRVPPDDRFVVS
jgi:hypothetical protein